MFYHNFISGRLELLTSICLIVVFFVCEGLMEDWFQPNERPSLNKEFTYLL